MQKVTWLYDATDLAKMGRADTLSVLDQVPGNVIITQEVYAELQAAAAVAQGAAAALNWINSRIAANDSHYVKIDQALVSAGSDAGERSLAQMATIIRTIDGPQAQINVVTDSYQSRQIGFLGADHVLYSYEAVNQLLLGGYISPAEYFSTIDKMALVGPIAQGGVGGTPFEIIYKDPNTGAPPLHHQNSGSNI